MSNSFISIIAELLTNPFCLRLNRCPILYAGIVRIPPVHRSVGVIDVFPEGHQQVIDPLECFLCLASAMESIQ